MSSPDDARLERHSRQMLLDAIGGAGQARLGAARVLCVGAGGLGSPVALYLAAAGVGHLTLLDPDEVSLSNLHRQVLHGSADLGRPKVESGVERLHELDPELSLEGMRARLDADLARVLFAEHDLIVDGSDNFETRFLCNDAALAAGKPLVHGGVLGFVGQVTLIDGRHGGCYRCLFEAPPPPGEVPPCSEAGVLGAVCGVIGSVMATEAIKRLVDPEGEALPHLAGRLFVWDGLAARGRTLSLPRREGCPACAAGGER
ncbi:MAG: HesA/MoeB/ThiF family protein [Deltaproteobacteria bacterium]|nr:HesA/MoeB/ThiF family protein [Deltaproteobacteria bacterium]